MRVIHASDLHLRDTAGERDYGISVLQDIIEIVRSTESQVLLITGDLFDSFDDTESLRRTVAERLATLPEPTRVLYIPGNHEYLRAKDRAFDRFEFGRAELHCAPPFSRVTIGAVEFLLIPHQANYGGYLEWSIPERRGAVRILAAHATVAGLFFNDSDEEGGGYLDRDLLERFDPDYVALGHIHAGQNFPAGRGDAVYPGSARVWRKGEFGPRSVVAVETDGDLSWRRIPIPSAGQYRNIKVSLDPDGRIGEDLDDLEVGPADLLDLDLVGVVESDTVLSTDGSDTDEALCTSGPRALRVDGGGDPCGRGFPGAHRGALSRGVASPRSRNPLRRRRGTTTPGVVQSAGARPASRERCD